MANPPPIGEWALFKDPDTEPTKKGAKPKADAIKSTLGIYDANCPLCSKRMGSRIQPKFDVITVDGKHCLVKAYCPVCGKLLGQDQYVLGDKVLDMIKKRDNQGQP